MSSTRTRSLLRLFATDVAALLALAVGAPVLAQGAAAPQTAAPQTAASKAPAPKVVVPDDKKDVGTVAKGEVIKQAFVVRNTGTADLLITDVKPACGCTVSQYDRVIKPGAEGKIALMIETKQFSGPIAKTALVLTNDPTTPQLTLHVSAYVKPYVETSPYGFFRIQALTGQTVDSDMILGSDDPAFAPSKIELPNKFLKATLTELPQKEHVAGKGAKQYKLTLSSTPESPEGLLSGYVKLQTGVKQQPDLELAISGYIKPTVTITPGMVNFGNFDPKGEAVRRNIMIIDNVPHRENFAVTKAETTIPGISAAIVPIDKGRIRVDLVVSDKIRKGVFEGELQIQTTDKAKGDVKVPIRGVIL
jgi:hypothetical protein